jgi:hypothetical protein
VIQNSTEPSKDPGVHETGFRSPIHIQASFLVKQWIHLDVVVLS